MASDSSETMSDAGGERPGVAPPEAAAESASTGGDSRSMLRRLYDWTLALAGHRRAEWGLGLISFLESSVFPIPPDVMLMPMVLAARERAWRLAAAVSGGGTSGDLWSAQRMTWWIYDRLPTLLSEPDFAPLATRG